MSEARPEISDVVQYPVLDGKTNQSDADADRWWVVLYPDDVTNLMIDEPGNVALLVDETQARELKRLAENAIAECGTDE